MKKSFLAALICAVAAAQVAKADDFSSKAYDALYERVTPIGQTKYRMCADGKGHVRIDSTIQSSDKAMSTIMDYAKKKSIMLLVDQKIAWVTDLTADSKQTSPMDEVKVKKLGGKILGERVIHGRKCHGYAWTEKGTQCQNWTGDDIGNCLVASVTNSMARGKVTMRLIKYAEGAPPADTFEIPPGFKVQKMGQLGDITKAANPPH